MRILAAPLVVGALLALAACGTQTGTTGADGGASDSLTTPAATRSMPTAVPASDGPVRTRNLVVVMDTGTPELCAGAVAESWPPQCGGPEISNWSWKKHGQGMFERQGKVRWGTYALTGSWDGAAFTVTEAVPAALHDPMVHEPGATPAPARSYSEAELAGFVEEVMKLPGAQGAYTADGHVLVDVLFDDGSLQAWADAEYGKDVVLVTGALVEA